MDEFKWILDKAWLALGAVMGIFYRSYKGELEALRKEIGTKADKDALAAQLDDVHRLFDEQGAIRKDMNGGFERITKLIHEGQIAVLTELAKKADR